jgi:Kef-type K+ transport system membrane component KefB
VDGIEFINLTAVMVIALVIPLLANLVPKAIRVPAVVLEILAGIAFGPSGLGWVHIDAPVQVLYLLGFSSLLFFAGLDVDVHRLRGAILRLALLGYLASLAIGVALGYGFAGLDWVKSPLLIGAALAATTSGTVVALLEDSGHVTDDLGQAIIAGCAVAEFGAVLLLSLAFPTTGGSAGGRVILFAGFGVLVAIVALAIRFAGASGRLRAMLAQLQDTTAEIRVRATMALMVGFAALAAKFGLDSILGAFLAGAVIGVVDRDGSTHPQFRVKLAAIGNGFLIPVFFVTAGLRLNVRELFDSPSAALRVLVFLIALLVVRGLPALLYRRRFGGRQAAATGLLQATTLSVIVAATQIGLQTGLITSVNAVALTCAAVLSVLFFPPVAVKLLGPGPGLAPAKAPVTVTVTEQEIHGMAAADGG